MSSKVYGILLMLSSIVIALIYIIGLVIAPDTIVYGDVKLSEVLMRYTVLILMLAIAGIIGYIGYLIFTLPIPKPVEEIIKEYRESSK
ncbi:MAG: hypothetical protein B6U89_01300 [Desulfurococcales archaeon ex4484_58]|nr:MAG: hypothetical protein B6U89_01300 [Desulfurococcales archaeon ex4484_58]